MIHLREIFDDNIILSVLKTPCIFPRVSSDGQTVENFVFLNKPEYIWMGIYNDDELIGLYFFHPVPLDTVQVHIQIFKDKRDKFAFDAGIAAMHWFIDSPYEKMIAEIPELYMDVYTFTKKFGFVPAGINKESYIKNGEIYDEFILELTKKGAEAWVQSIK